IRRAVQIDPRCRHASCLEFVQALKGENKAAVDPAAWSLTSRPPVAKEKRQATRYPCAVATLCEHRTSIHSEATTAVGQWPGQVLNLSATGVGLLLARRFEPGTVVAVVLENSTRTFQVRVNVRVIRLLQAEKNQWFLGAAFTEPLPK